MLIGDRTIAWQVFSMCACYDPLQSVVSPHSWSLRPGFTGCKHQGMPPHVCNIVLCMNGSWSPSPVFPPLSVIFYPQVQYPDALQVMTEDLINLRAISAFLSRTELKFDLVSAVDELQKQIHLEFNFMR